MLKEMEVNTLMSVYVWRGVGVGVEMSHKHHASCLLKLVFEPQQKNAGWIQRDAAVWPVDNMQRL